MSIDEKGSNYNSYDDLIEEDMISTEPWGEVIVLTKAVIMINIFERMCHRRKTKRNS